MWGSLEQCAKAVELQCRIGQPVELQVVPHLHAALAAFLQLVLAHLEAHRADPRVQTLGCELLGGVLDDPSGRRCLAGIPVGETLLAAARAHPGHEGVQRQAWRALGRLEGVHALRHIMADQALSDSLVVVRNAMAQAPGWAEALRDKGASWAERVELANVAKQLMVKFPQAPWLHTNALKTIELLLSASLPQETEIYGFVGFLFEEMQSQMERPRVVFAASTTILALCEGSGQVMAQMRNEPRIQDLLGKVLVCHAKQGDPQVLNRLAVLHLAIFGLPGLFAAVDALRRQGLAEDSPVVPELLHAVSEAEDDMFAVDVRCVEMACELGRGRGPCSAAAIKAVGRLCEMCLQDPSKAKVAADGVQWILKKVRDELGQEKDHDVEVFHTAMDALRACALRSGDVSRFLVEAGIVQLIDKIVEDHWHFFSCSIRGLQQVLYAMALFGGVEAVLAKMRKYPEAAVLAQASFNVLTDVTDAADPVMGEGALESCAAGILERCYAVSQRQGERFAGARLSAGGCMGAYLKHAIAAGTLQDGFGKYVIVIVDTLKKFVTKAQKDKDWAPVLGLVRGLSLAFDGLRVLSLRPDGARSDSQALLGGLLNYCQAVDPLSELCKASDSDLAQEAALVLALLRGPEALLQLLEECPNELGVQRAAVRGLGELMRRQYSFTDAQLYQRVVAVLQGASASPSVASLAEVALGLVSAQAQAMTAQPPGPAG